MYVKVCARMSDHAEQHFRYIILAYFFYCFVQVVQARYTREDRRLDSKLPLGRRTPELLT